MADSPQNSRDLSPLTALPTSQMPHIQDLGPPPPNTPPVESTSGTQEECIFWISPPPLDPMEKEKYKIIPNLFPSTSPRQDDEDETPVEIVGETRLGTDLYFWVLHENEVIHRHLAKEFSQSYGGLVSSYNDRKEAGNLDPFDDKSPQIHPKDRLHFKITIPGKKARLATRTTRSAPSRAAKQNKPIVESSDDEMDDSQGSYDSEDDDDEHNFKGKAKKIAIPTRRSTRAVAKDTKASYRDFSESPVQKRANPKRHATRKREDEDDYLDDGYEGQDVSEDSGTPEPKKRKVIRGRLSHPAYGNIRHVADLSGDEDDEDTAPLRAHQDTCEKCDELPAHEQLKKYYKRGKRKKSIKKANTDDFEDEDDTEQRLLKLGGWVRCLKCCVVSHWACLRRAQRDEIIKATRSKEREAEAAGFRPLKRDALEAYDTTEFICGGCMKGEICMHCLKTAVEPEPLPEKKDQVDIPEVTQNHSSNSGAAGVKAAPDVNKGRCTPPPAIMIVNPAPRKEDTEPMDTTDDSHCKTFGPSRNVSPTIDTQELLFRCKTCKRLAHYAHLPQPEPHANMTSIELAQYYQLENEWKCTDCDSFIHALDKILAWRPFPQNVKEASRRPGELPDYKGRLPREYLVKWVGASYRRLRWVPHMWLLSTSPSKLKNFLATGPKVQLMQILPSDVDKGKEGENLSTDVPAKESNPSFLIVDAASRGSSAQPRFEEEGGPPQPLLDAEQRIPSAWRTVDRVLDIRVWNPATRRRSQKRKKSSKRGKAKRLDSDDDEEEEQTFLAEVEAQRIVALELGEEPSGEHMETLDEWESRTGETFSIEHAELVIWAFIKWNDLTYDEATWDSPPVPTDDGYPAFLHACQRFIDSRTVFVPKKDKKAIKQFDDRPMQMFQQKQLLLKSDPELGQQGKLMDFQLTGVNWLFRNWWKHQPSILADEMGLGKTVQIVCLVGHLIASFQALPVLIVVPNSTITNWLREFSRWAPRLRVVPYSGEGKSREIIRKYELYHESAPDNKHTNLKFHVLVTTYDTLIGKDFTAVFKSVPRWELLIIDEGQRLKNEASLLFKRLNELNTVHRILMTGTPLNNNIRELFNLMNFLDAEKWANLAALEKKYENLTEELLQELHEDLKPYFLRRTKADVLKLPPKNEVIVPVSMTAIQKEVYKSILSQNMEILGSLAQPSSVNTAVKKSNLNNVLMQLRKCLQHPYLISRELEPNGSGLTPQLVHKNLVDASAKLRLLHVMLPKLKAKGHRVLLFSQFVMALDIIEDFLVGEGYKFLRLDGNTKQAQRQKDMDAFNQPNSDIFIFLLSTRAGGVGINLWSADTVIIFDPDFNPHQDMQAISRAHRYGQTKTVLVFKLMVKGAAEERIVQTGKRKLALDHLIVQKMDDENAGDDVQSILTFGAKAVFENSETNDINYSEVDIENLITRTEKEGDEAPEAANASFGFAKLWVVEKDAMEEVVEDAPADSDDDGFWSNVVARAAAEKAKAKAAEVTGRGAKRRAAVTKKYYYGDDSPAKPKSNKRRKSTDDSDVEYNALDTDSDEDQTTTTTSKAHSPLLSGDLPDQLPRERTASISPGPSVKKPRPSYKPALTAIENRKRGHFTEDEDEDEFCGLCQKIHGPGSCDMTHDPTNLIDYRLMLMEESKEPIEMRRSAVQAIDAHLASRGLSEFTKEQPINFVVNGDVESIREKRHKQKHSDSQKRSSSPSRRTKKQKTDFIIMNPCVICDGPFHLAKACPVVKAGPQSIQSAIARLSEDPQFENTVNILRSLLPREP
ncbi:hypothetical protein K439DRAFT_1663741 [Ramaria rubella]|nr:hypothetical protein K439DRAFT_1663741 [Ramaria rubella]